MQRFIFILFLLCISLPHLHSKTYHLTDDPIDIIIPCCEKDVEVLEKCIYGAKRNIPNIRRIIVVSPKKYTDNAEWYDEAHYPFSMQDVANELTEGGNKSGKYFGIRVGWYFQQLLKLYAHLVIPGISSNLLILDSDTIFLRPVEFLNDKSGGFYAFGKGTHPPYFDHMKKLLPGFEPVYENESAIVHHMLFQREILLDLLKTIEEIHDEEAWRVLCRLVDPRQSFSGFSEYEIYFNFAFSNTDQVSIRPLKFRNIANISDIPYWKKKGYDFVSCHHYMRSENPS